MDVNSAEHKQVIATFTRLCEGDVKDRMQAYVMLEQSGRAKRTPVEGGGAVIDYLAPADPFVKIFRETSPSQGLV